MVQPSQCPRSHRARGARKVGPGSRPLPEGIEVCCRSRSHDSSAWASPVPNPTTHCRHMRLSEKPASAVHRNWSSGRRSLSERPSTRCSDSRAMPAPGSAGPEGCPASHAPPLCGREEKSLSTFLLSLTLASEPRQTKFGAGWRTLAYDGLLLHNQSTGWD